LLGNKETSSIPHPEERGEKIQLTTPQWKSQKKRVGCLGRLTPISDLLKVVLVFDQEQDISIHSHQTKVELVLKIGL